MAAPRVDNKYWDEIAKARVELQNLISKENYKASNLLRLAYASQFSIANAGTNTSAKATPNNPQSTINNLKNKIDNIRCNHPKITSPDLYQLAGVVALENLAGGPNIKFVPGREDSTISPDEGCLPDVSVQDLRDVFRRVGISDSNLIVALCGGLKLASRADADKSGEQGATPIDQAACTEKNLKFDNSYFMELNKKQELSMEDINKLPMEPIIDKALLKDKEFRSVVHRYATDEKAFKGEYEVAHEKLSEFGLPHSALDNSTSLSKNMPVTVTQRAVGVAVAAAVVIFSVFYLINRRRANKYSSQQFN